MSWSLSGDGGGGGAALDGSPALEPAFEPAAAPGSSAVWPSSDEAEGQGASSEGAALSPVAATTAGATAAAPLAHTLAQLTGRPHAVAEEDRAASAQAAEAVEV